MERQERTVVKIFISHATPDRDLASKFVDLLQLGVGIAREQIFFSSYPGSIPNAAEKKFTAAEAGQHIGETATVAAWSPAVA